jgi:hypothetical protein
MREKCVILEYKTYVSPVRRLVIKALAAKIY